MAIHNYWFWFRDFCGKTTSHCSKYFVMKNRSLLEKVFWILIFCYMTSITFYALKSSVNVWINSPTIMFIENTESSIREIPFPSITICPSNQMRKRVYEKYRSTNSLYREDIRQYHELICNSNTYTSLISYKNSFLEFIDYDTVKRLMNECASSCSELFQFKTKWQNTTIDNICDYIQPMSHFLGVCYALNMMPTLQLLNDHYHKRYLNFFNSTYVVTEKSKWNIDDGYLHYLDKNILVNVVPARTSGVSYYHRLKLFLFLKDEEFVGCPNNRLENFFFISLSNPAEYYSYKKSSFIVPYTYTTILITPIVKRIKWDLRSRSPEVRKCYLHNERKLSIFQQYNEINCNHECVINETISTCGCINIELAYLATSGMKVCGPAKRNCMERVKRESFLPSMQKLCNCLPTCSTIEYEMTDTSHYDDWTYMKMTNLVKNNSRGASVEIVFKKPYFTAYEAASIVDIYSFISTIGGILSLLLGINMINIFEMLYVFIQMVYYYIKIVFDYN